VSGPMSIARKLGGKDLIAARISARKVSISSQAFTLQMRRGLLEYITIHALAN